MCRIKSIILLIILKSTFFIHIQNFSNIALSSCPYKQCHVDFSQQNFLTSTFEILYPHTFTHSLFTYSLFILIIYSLIHYITIFLILLYLHGQDLIRLDCIRYRIARYRVEFARIAKIVAMSTGKECNILADIFYVT